MAPEACPSPGPDGFVDTIQLDASDEVDDAFPDVLKAPILRKVQFSTISRLDHLGMVSHDLNSS